MERKLFDLVHAIGEQLTGDLHVIDTTDTGCYDYHIKYRVYHSTGYCFDVERITETDDETEEIISRDYVIYNEWDGFEKLDTEGYIKLIQNAK